MMSAFLFRAFDTCTLVLKLLQSVQSMYTGQSGLLENQENKRDEISTHSWMHFREQFPFVEGGAHIV